MHCPRCETENTIGAVYCTSCGAKLELTEDMARAEAVASVSHENWERAYHTMARTLFFFFLIFMVSLLFNAYARRTVIADFGVNAPVPPPPPLTVTGSFIKPPKLPIPSVGAAVAIKPDNENESEIIAGLTQTTRDRLSCILVLRTGGAIRGILLSRTEEKISVITQSGRTRKIHTIGVGLIDFEKSKLPE